MMIDFDYYVMYKKYAQPKQAYKTPLFRKTEQKPEYQHNS